MKPLLATLLLLFATQGFAGDSGEQRIHVKSAQVAASVGAARAGSGYLTLMNAGAQSDRLMLVEAEFPRVQIHDVVEVGGQTRMVWQEQGIALPAGKTLEMKPGGLHVMFMGLQGPFAIGETFDAVLVFEREGRMPVTFTVVARDDIVNDHHEGSDHD